MGKPLDILIQQAAIADGTGARVRTGDIGIAQGKIAVMERKIPTSSAHRVIDARGLTASPGFIDPHSHDDVYLMINSSIPEKIRQGVTTVVTGNCGMSAAPVSERYESQARQATALLGTYHMDDRIWPITHFAQYLDLIKKERPAVNIAPLIGHITLRTSAMGMDTGVPGKKQMSRMTRMLAEAMQSGAFGFSTGLVYFPGLHAEFDEIRALADVAVRFGGIYATHIRSEADQVMTALAEAFEVGRQTGIPVHVSHHKVMGQKNWNRSRETLNLFAQTEREGLRVSFDVYPYTAGSTSLAAAIPPAFLSDGPGALSWALKRPEIRNAVKKIIKEDTDAGWENLVKVDTFKGMVLNHVPSHPEYSGQSIHDIANHAAKDPYDILFDLIMDDPLETTMIEFMMSDQDVDRIIRHPMSMIGSDGIPGFGPLLFHPRFTSTFPRVLGHYVREKRLLSLEQGVQKMTGIPAAVFGLQGKGVLTPGHDADIVLFDPGTIRDRATFKEPELVPDGISWVFVNGRAALESGCLTDVRAGNVLSRTAVKCGIR